MYLQKTRLTFKFATRFRKRYVERKDLDGTIVFFNSYDDFCDFEHFLFIVKCLPTKENLASVVSREGLWKILEKYGCPRKCTAMTRKVYDGMHAKVQDSGESSPPSEVTNGVKQQQQRCVFAPI